MGFFDDIFGQPFGGLFDINGDGKTDIGEEWLGFMIINECMKGEEESCSGSHFFINFETDKDSALGKKINWRDYCEDGSDYGVDPYDFDDEDEYNEALEEAKNLIDYNCEIKPEINTPIKLTFNFVWPGQETLDAIKEKNYPNKRQYQAACYLCQLQQGSGYIPSGSTKEFEIEKCHFILTAKSIAAKYLTVSDGFLYVQAVKENFELPIAIKDEDEKVENDFRKLFIDIAKKNPKLAVDIWVWIIKEFSAFKQYIRDGWTIYNSILISTNDCPDEFLSLLIKKLGSDISFCNSLITENPNFPYGLADIITKALETGCVKEAQIIFTAVAMNQNANAKNMEDLICDITCKCSNWKELETIESFNLHILPIIKKMKNEHIQALLPNLIENISYYINRVESCGEKYQYSRKFAWRNKYAKQPLYDINPLDYSTEEEYNKAVHKKKEYYSSEQRLKELIFRIQNGDVWEEDVSSSAPETINFTFTYPNGKRGDIDMYLSKQLGEVRQIGATEFTAIVPSTEKENISLLAPVYTVKWNDTPRTEIQSFMYTYNLFHKLRQECDDFMRSGPNRQNHPLRNEGRKIASNYIENVRKKRREIYSQIAEKGLATTKWVSEQKAYAIIKSLYSDAIYQYTAEWLGEQSIDIYIPSQMIAIEYQGSQHYQAVEFFGGKKGYEQTIKRDDSKKQKCMTQGVTLIEWRFDEPLTEECIKNKIDEAISNSL